LKLAFVTVGTILASLASAATADDMNGGVLVRVITNRPLNGVATESGGDVELALVPWGGVDMERCAPHSLSPNCLSSQHYRNPLYLGLGAFVGFSNGTNADTRRDLYGVRVSSGLGSALTKWLVPFATIGLDALFVATDLPNGSHHRGPTLGIDVRAGILGTFGSSFMYSISASYLGAVAPGTGDNAGGLLLGVGLGWRLWQGHDD